MITQKSSKIFLFLLLIFSGNLACAQDNQQMVKLSSADDDAPAVKKMANKSFAKANSNLNAKILSFKKASQEKANFNEIASTDSIMRDGERSIRFELNRTDSNVAGKKRCELIVAREPRNRAERWYGFGVFLPSSFVPDQSPEIISQLHAAPDSKNGGIWRSPPIALMTRNGNWYVNVIGAATTDTTNIKDEVRKYIELGSAQTNSWTDWVLHVIWRNDNNGLLEIWKNGQLVQQYHGPTIYNKTLGTFWKIGIYKWDWTPGHKAVPSSTNKRVAYFDNVKTLGGSSTYQDFSKS